jgi:hypothetical protein
VTSINFNKIEKLLKNLGKESKKKGRSPHKKYLIEIEGVPSFFVPFSRGTSGEEAGNDLIKDFYKELKIDKKFFIELVNGVKTKKDYEAYIKKKHKERKL